MPWRPTTLQQITSKSRQAEVVPGPWTSHGDHMHDILMPGMSADQGGWPIEPHDRSVRLGEPQLSCARNRLWDWENAACFAAGGVRKR
jgi:hypothetical protein